VKKATRHRSAPAHLAAVMDAPPRPHLAADLLNRGEPQALHVERTPAMLCGRVRPRVGVAAKLCERHRQIIRRHDQHPRRIARVAAPRTRRGSLWGRAISQPTRSLQHSPSRGEWRVAAHRVADDARLTLGTRDLPVTGLLKRRAGADIRRLPPPGSIRRSACDVCGHTPQGA
jgi:hypothetical protein